MLPDCYLIPPGIVGHPTGSCPYGQADDDGDIQAGRQLVRQSGASGTPVTVWVEDSSPQRAYARYYTKLLNRLGFTARMTVTTSSHDFGRIGKSSTDPQTGFASWFNDFPNPIDFYSVLDSHAIGPPGSPNVGRVSDLFIQQQLEKPGPGPAAGPGLHGGRNGATSTSTAATKAYLAVIRRTAGAEADQRRIDFNAAVIHPLFLSDWSSWSLH